MKECWPRVTPRLRTFWESLMLVPFKQISEGMGALFSTLLAEIRIISVLSSFNCNLLFIIQSFKSEIQHWVDWMIPCSCKMCPDLYSLLSSEKLRWDREWWCTMSESGWVYSTKRIGPSTEPCSTPHFITDEEEEFPLTEATWVRSKRYDQNQERAVSEMPKAWWRRGSKVSSSMISKAAEGSNKDNKEIWLSSRAVRRSFTILRRAVSVLWHER